MIVLRALIAWLLLIAAEIVHGIARGVLLVPSVGQFHSSQIGVFTGSAIILAIALVTVRWISASRCSQLLGIGVLWAGLTLAFEILFGRFVVGVSWERLLSDQNILQCGLMPFGMIVLVLSPWIAGKWRDGSTSALWLADQPGLRRPVGGVDWRRQR